jgi:DNA-binding NarL/FixJ family response regulator
VPVSPRARPWRPSHPDPTDRELEVLLGISDGKTFAAIGSELGIAEPTVKQHARHLYKRIGARERAHAVRLGFERGWLEPHDPRAEPIALGDTRELQILRLLADGRTFPNIAVRLVLPEDYVKHLTRPIYQALGARDRAHAVRKGFEHGLLSRETEATRAIA